MDYFHASHCLVYQISAPDSVKAVHAAACEGNGQACHGLFPLGVMI